MVLYATGGGAWTESIPDGQIMGSHLVAPRAPVFVRVGKLPAQVLYAGTAPDWSTARCKSTSCFPRN